MRRRGRRDGGRDGEGGRDRDRARGCGAGTAPREGIVVAGYGPRARVRAAGGDEDGQAQERTCLVPRRVGLLCAGDEVLWRPAPGGGIVEARKPRRTLLVRPEPAGPGRPIAANVDHLVVVVAPEPATPRGLLDRYLVIGELQGLPPIIVLNKADLLPSGPEEAESPALPEWLAPYRRLGYPVIVTSAATGLGLEGLEEALDARTHVFAGPSGVGKSSLVARLAPGLDVRTGALTRRGQGRHTTSTARLYFLPCGARVVDSPGVRDMGVWQLPPRTIAEGFPEIRSRARECRFRDCLHRGEAGCAVATDPDIDPERLASYRALLEEALERGERH